MEILNPEILKAPENDHKSKSSLTNVITVGEDLMRAFYKLFIYDFVFQVISGRTLRSKDFTNYLRDIFT